MEIETIEEGYFYHIYNRGNNGGVIFMQEINYQYFLKLLEKYIVPVADVYAYCLMENHFHFLLKIRNLNEVNFKNLKYSTVNKAKVVNFSYQFSHFINAYSQAINKKYERSGSLFEKPFERKKIENKDYIKQAVLYINCNPLKHKIVDDLKNFMWSSYKSHISNQKTNIKRSEVIELFDNLENFIWCHHNYDYLNQKL
jgi:putative transposase